MAELEEPTFTVELEGFGRFGNNKDFSTNIKSYSIQSSYFMATDGWSFEVHDENEPALLRRVFKPLQPVKLYIDDALQVVGRIDRTTGVSGSSSLNVSGRDYLADLADGGADPAIRFKKGIDVGTAVLQVIGVFGINGIVSDGFTAMRNLMTGKAPFTGKPRDFKTAKHDEFKVGYNQGAWQVIEKIASRHGFTIQPTQDRATVALAEPVYNQPALYTIHRTIDGQNTNVLRATASRDWSKIPTTTIAQGRGGRGGGKISGLNVTLFSFGTESPSALGTLDEVERIVGLTTFRPAVLLGRIPANSDVRPIAGVVYRPMYYNDTDSRNREQLERGARRMLAERMRRTLQYRCTVRGHSDPQTGAIYGQDTIANIKDEIEDVDEPMWLQERTLRNSGSGPETDLVFIRPDSYVL